MEASNLNWETESWNRLAIAFRDSRNAQELTQAEAAEKAGISRASLQNIERGGRRLRMATVHALARALKWPSSHAEDVLAGRAEGPPAKLVSEGPPESSKSDLPLLIERELGQGSLLDSQVVSLGEDSGARVIVVLRGDVDMTDEQMEEALMAWRQMRKNVEDSAKGND
jgi:transcriptional regulator with XRE-family HTH domain